MLITTQGPQPGAVLVEWNMRDPEGAQGSAGMWEVHFRVGGAVGTNIDPKNCPRGTGANAPADKCTGAWALMRMTETSSAYLENVWGWVADHDLDYDDQINVYNARGFLCEAKAGPVWMYGTAFEHSILYQYNFVNGAANVLLAMIQTETPYFQPSLQTPFLEMAIHPTDPSFCTGDSRCNMSFGLVIGEESHDFFIYGTGLYSFFYQWSQLCLESGNGPDCQLEMIKIHDSARTFMPFNVNTYGTVYMQTQAESYSKAIQHTNTFCSTAVADLNHAA